MPQRVIVIYVCSLCRSESEDKSAVTEFTLTGSGRTITLDVCNACRESGPLADILTAGLDEQVAGKKPKPSAPPAKPTNDDLLPCPTCGQECKGPTGLGRHRAYAHGHVGSSWTAQKRHQERVAARVVPAAAGAPEKTSRPRKG